MKDHISVLTCEKMVPFTNKEKKENTINISFKSSVLRYDLKTPLLN